MTKLFVSLIASFLIGVAAHAAEPFKWTHVGGDPCNPKAGCTLEWALGKTGWPDDVKVGLIAAVKGIRPETVSITSGLGGSTGPAWRGWMTWGKYNPKFETNVVAAWPDGQYQPASHWFTDRDRTRYNLIKVKACGNWGGWTEVLPPPVVVPPPVAEPKVEAPSPPPEPPKPQPMPIGTLPIVACVN